VLFRSQLTIARANIASTRAELHELEELYADLQNRRTQIQQQISERRAALPMLRAKVADAEQAVAAAEQRKEIAVAKAAAVIGMPRDAMTESVTVDGETMPRWRSLSLLTVTAERAGVVHELAVTDGSWVHEGDRVLRTLRPQSLLFRAVALQSDIPRLQEPMTGQIVPPSGGQLATLGNLPVSVRFGLDGDPRDRDVEIIATWDTEDDTQHWGRHGLAAALEINAEGTGRYSIAVPRRAIVKDGLESILFRRDPNDPNKVIRTPVPLGASDGRWVEVRAGVAVGDEIVLDGSYELMLASSSVSQEGGHFHADGTFHAGDHEDE